jgi:hypothetical protein
MSPSFRSPLDRAMDDNIRECLSVICDHIMMHGLQVDNTSGWTNVSTSDGVISKVCGVMKRVLGLHCYGTGAARGTTDTVTATTTADISACTRYTLKFKHTLNNITVP